MIKKTITYTDYNGDSVTEEHYFNLNKMELMELEISEGGGLSERLKEIIETEDAPKILKALKEIVYSSYGIKSADGKRFIKTADIREEFEQSEASSELFMELITNPDSASAFINGIVPSSLAEDMSKLQDKLPVEPVANVENPMSPFQKNLEKMDLEELRKALREKQ